MMNDPRWKSLIVPYNYCTRPERIQPPQNTCVLRQEEDFPLIERQKQLSRVLYE